MIDDDELVRLEDKVNFHAKLIQLFNGHEN